MRPKKYSFLNTLHCPIIESFKANKYSSLFKSLLFLEMIEAVRYKKKWQKKIASTITNLQID